MWDIFIFAINAVVPIILQIGLGILLRRIGLFDDKFLKTANRVVFKVALPILLFSNVYSIESFADIDFLSVGYAMLSVFALFLLGWLTVRLFVKKPEQKGVIVQAAFRSNYAIIGIPLAEALGGPETLAVASVILAFTVFLFNILAVVALNMFVGGSKPNIKQLLRQVVTNPMIIGICLGLITLLVRGAIPVDAQGAKVFSMKDDLKFVYSAINSVAKMASPLALITLGGQFKFSAVKEMKGQIVLGTAWKIVFAPIIGLGCALVLDALGALDLGAAHYASFIALYGSPIAVSSAIMAGEMKNDAQLANQILVWSSIFSTLTLFLIICLFKWVGLI